MLLRTIGTNTHEKQNAPKIINCALHNLIYQLIPRVSEVLFYIMRNSQTTRGVATNM